MSKYMACSGYAIGACSCRTTLRRDLAETLILSGISEKVFSKETVKELLFDTATEAWHTGANTRPAEIQTLEESLNVTERRITRLMRRCEDEDSPELTKQLNSRCEERDAMKRKLRQLTELGGPRTTPPTRTCMESELKRLRDTLAGSIPAAAAALRRLLAGPIVASEVKKPGKNRHFLRASFSIKLHAAIASDDKVGELLGERGTSEVVIDIREPHQYERLSAPIKEDFDSGLLIDQIKEKHGCSYTVVDRALNYWHQVHGTNRTDGRTLRSRLPKQRASDRLKDEVMVLWRQDLQVQEIAKKLDCGLETVRAAVVDWHQENGLPVPDGRQRRREIRLRREGGR